MTLVTRQLQTLLTSGTTLTDFKSAAMNLARLGADIMVGSAVEPQLTLLHVLARTNKDGINNDEMAELVGLNAAILECKDKRNRTALQYLLDVWYSGQCSLDDFKQLAMTLVRLEADITVHSTLGPHSTLLHVLVCMNKDGINNDDIVELVELNRAVLVSQDKHGRTALQSLLDSLHRKEITFDDFKQTAMILAGFRADVSLQGTADSCSTLLHVLVHHHINKNEKEINDLISLNPDIVNVIDGNGRTPIHFLLHNNSSVTIDVFEKLLSDSNVHAKDKQSATLLHAACRSGNLLAVEYLLSRKLDICARTNKNETLLHSAMFSGDRILLQRLIDTKQIDINVKNQAGETVLDHAIRQANPKVIELFVRNELSNKIQVMHDYGLLLTEQGAEQGLVAMSLAQDLNRFTKQFFEQKPGQRNVAEFTSTFSALLHSYDQQMSSSMSWGAIVANIAIALTGIGLLFIAVKLLHSNITEGQPLFFFQKRETAIEEKIADIEQTARLIA